MDQNALPRFIIPELFKSGIVKFVIFETNVCLVFHFLLL